MSGNNPFEDAQKVLGSSKEVVYSDTELTRINAIAQAVGKLQDLLNIMAVTDLTDHQISLFEKAEILGQYWDIEEMDGILRGLAIKRLSRNRKSRDEIIKVLTGINAKKGFKQKVKTAINGEGDE